MSRLLHWEQFSANQIEDIMQDLAIKPTGENSEWLYVYCPYHNNTDTRAAEVNLETGFFYCFACNTRKSLVDLVMDMRDCNEFSALRFISEHGSHSKQSIDIDSLFDTELKVFDYEIIDQLHANLYGHARAIAYVVQRGVWDVAHKFKIGYSSKQDMITVPVDHPHRFDAYVGFVARSLEGKQFKNSKGLPRKSTLFGIQSIGDADHIYLTESSFDAMLLHVAQLPAVASLGSTISKEQIRLLSRWRDIMIVQDNDDAGDKMVERVRKELPQHNISKLKWQTTQKDIGQIYEEEGLTAVTNTIKTQMEEI